MCHPLSGYLIKVFLDAFELGRVWGSVMSERVIKPNAGYYYAHGLGLRSKFPDQGNVGLVMDSANLFWGVEKTIPPEALARGNPPAVPKIQPHEEGYMEAQAKCQEKLRDYSALSQKFYEGIYIKEDFDLLLEKCHELVSKDLFAHISKHRDDEAERRKYAVHFESTGETFYDSPCAIKFDPQLIYKKCKRVGFSPESKFVSRAYKELSGYCAFLETEFSRQHSAMDFDSYDELLRSINVAESLESIPPVMFEVLGTVLEDVPERSAARVYRAPHTDGVGVGNPAGTLRAVEALNGARTVFQSDEDRAILVREEDLDDLALEPEQDDIDDCTTEPGDEIMSDRSETMLDMEDETGSPTGEVFDDFAEVFQLPTITGEEDEEMIPKDIFSPEEVIEVQADDVPTQEDNQTNEAGVLDFLESVAEHSKEAPHDNGDVLSPNDFEMEFTVSPFRVIDAYYGGNHRGREIWVQRAPPRDTLFTRWPMPLAQVVLLRHRLLPKLLGIGPLIEARAICQFVF